MLPPVQEFLLTFRKDITVPIAPFTVESIDGGVNNTQAPGTLEAVGSRYTGTA